MDNTANAPVIACYRYICTATLGMVIFPAAESHEYFWRRTYIIENPNEFVSLGFIELMFDKEKELVWMRLDTHLDWAEADKEALKARMAEETSTLSVIAAFDYFCITDELRARDFQRQTETWLNFIFKRDVVTNTTERCHRFLEEAIELVQALHYPRDKAHQMVDYVYDRPKGEVEQEIGGVVVSLCALGVGIGVRINDVARTELKRCFNNIDKIRQKQYTKPKEVSEMHN